MSRRLSELIRLGQGSNYREKGLDGMKSDVTIALAANCFGEEDLLGFGKGKLHPVVCIKNAYPYSRNTCLALTHTKLRHQVGVWLEIDHASYNTQLSTSKYENKPVYLVPTFGKERIIRDIGTMDPKVVDQSRTVIKEAPFFMPTFRINSTCRSTITILREVLCDMKRGRPTYYGATFDKEVWKSYSKFGVDKKRDIRRNEWEDTSRHMK